MSSPHSPSASQEESLGRVGLIGLGNVGIIYAEHLIRASEALVVFDVDFSRLEQAVERGAQAAASSREVAAQCDVIVLALPNSKAVRQEMLGEDGILPAGRAGSLIVDISTIDPDTSVAVYEDARRCGIDYVEAPMSGAEPGGAGIAGARQASITFMVGADEAAFKRAKPVLDILGKYSFHLGPVGNGNIVKIISNHIAGIIMAATAEGFVLGAAAGIHHETLLEVFNHTDAKHYTLHEEFGPRLTNNDYEGGFSVDLMHKDHYLASELGRKFDVPLFFNQLAMETYQIARSQGAGRKPYTYIVEILAAMAGVELFNKDRR